MRNEDQDLLTTELAPRKREELQIHNKKLGELSHWFTYAFPEGSNAPCALFLTGPTGSGKSTAVEVLCNESGIEVIDYTPELLHNDLLEHEAHGSEQLIRFLSRRHGSLNGGATTKRVLLVSELPDEAYKDAETFREKLTEAFSGLRHPVIFCLSNEVSSWNLNPNRIFSDRFLQQNSIDVLAFNPVADTFMKKALQRASNLLKQPFSETKLKVIGEEARGDLRLAMNMLQVNAVGPRPDRQSGSKMICAAKANREEAFHMIGRILYAKRINPNAPKPQSFASKRRKSAQPPEPKERTPLEHDPTDIIQMSSMTSDKLISFLFENEHVFCSDIKKYRQVAETLSACDVFSTDWSSAKALPDVYVSQMATRSVMWHNYKCNRPKTLFHVRRSAMKDLDREIRSTMDEILRLPAVGTKYFSALTAPYVRIIREIIDPCRIEFFVSRPLNISWKMGKDQIEEQMERKYGQVVKIRAKTKGRLVEKRKTEDSEEEEEKFTIEESSEEDSFDEF